MSHELHLAAKLVEERMVGPDDLAFRAAVRSLINAAFAMPEVPKVGHCTKCHETCAAAEKRNKTIQELNENNQRLQISVRVVLEENRKMQELLSTMMGKAEPLVCQGCGLARSTAASHSATVFRISSMLLDLAKEIDALLPG